MKKFFLLSIVIALLTMSFAVSVVSAEGLCTYNSQHGWHIVGGGTLNDHWFETEEECLAALYPEETPTDLPTLEPTVTSTPVPTDLPTLEPTLEPTITSTPVPTETLVFVPTEGSDVRPALSCYAAWVMIDGKKFKDEGYRFFENPEHDWCQVWLFNHYGINYDYYKLLNP